MKVSLLPKFFLLGNELGTSWLKMFGLNLYDYYVTQQLLKVVKFIDNKLQVTGVNST